jgi:hypothetical protein
MKERDIVEVNSIEESDLDESQCMSAARGTDSACYEDATKEIVLTYDGEPDKKFFTYLCGECASEYLKKWDRAQIMG